MENQVRKNANARNTNVSATAKTNSRVRVVELKSTKSMKKSVGAVKRSGGCVPCFGGTRP